MENEIKEILDEGTVTELNTVNTRSKIAGILGIAAIATTSLLFVFRKKIAAKHEEKMVKKLTKKGYTVYEPINDIPDDSVETIE